MGMINKIPNIQCPTPEGAFYIFFIVSKYFGCTTPKGEVLNDADQMCAYFVKEKNVAMVAGLFLKNVLHVTFGRDSVPVEGFLLSKTPRNL
jgi:aspartate/methionine/tyrosine aminotransferase